MCTSVESCNNEESVGPTVAYMGEPSPQSYTGYQHQLDQIVSRSSSSLSPLSSLYYSSSLPAQGFMLSRDPGPQSTILSFSNPSLHNYDYHHYHPTTTTMTHFSPAQDKTTVLPRHLRLPLGLWWTQHMALCVSELCKKKKFPLRLIMLCLETCTR